MVARIFSVRHGSSTFDLDYDTDDGLEIVSEDDSKVVTDDFDLISISEKLRLILINDQVKSSSSDVNSHVNEDLLKLDEEFARMLQAEEEALLLQQYTAMEDNGQMEQKIRGYIDQVLMYEDPTRQEAARRTVPVDELEEKALVAIAKKEGKYEPTKDERDHAFLLELLLWFKKSFSWVHAPACDGCGNQTTSQGMCEALPEELRYGGIRVELYSFWKLEKGVVGSGPTALHYIAEHLATNLVFWQKKLNYVIAIAKDGVHDVTKRYTRKWHEVLTRRNFTTEPKLCQILANLTKQCRRGFKPETISFLEERDSKERETLERNLHSEDDAAVSLPGRQTGDKQWRISRSEYGSGEGGILSSSCPVRPCFDEHVTKIYDALGMVLSQLVGISQSESMIVTILKEFRNNLKDLKKSPFRSRRTLITHLDGLDPSLEKVVRVFDEILDALGMKPDLDSSSHVLLAGHPVKTSLALPVALDAFDDMIESLVKYDSFGKDILSLPILKLNRIHSGSVLASGEELPFGIATSAFDGLRVSKWEEPNGAKGCWIAYKLKEKHMCELVAYELMSANDAPERDPMDWILEASTDGGSTWNILDRQTSQKFDGRFERKLYKIKSCSPQSNAFRLSFSAVRKSESNSRLQVGSIDLYASNDEVSR
ncbi:hypothetical protein KSS87_000163 [Heliosperma pusillum]|nr:hypothetical protein KSS87_000163 [Heliosperma pusillum]